MTPTRLFFVELNLNGSTMVFARSEEDAREIAAELDHSWYDDLREDAFTCTPIERLDQVSERWIDEVPYSYPGQSHGYEKATCRDYLTWNRFQSSWPTDQMLIGATILEPPASDHDIALYKSFGVHRSSSNIFFTTLTPLPDLLEQYALCKAAPYSSDDGKV